MPVKKTNPLAALHAARSAAEAAPEEKPLPDDDGPDPIQLAVVQGLAANPAMVVISPEEFAARADALIDALGIPPSMLKPGSGTLMEHHQREDHMQHVRTLLNEIKRSEHALHNDKHDVAACDICAARKWLENFEC